MIFKKKKQDLYLKASKLALDNSRLIYDEAKLLVDENHYARGFALCVISLEESAKSFLLRLVSLDLVYEYKTLKFVRIHENKLQQSSQILSLSSKLIEAIIGLVEMAQKAGYRETELSLPKDYKEKLEQIRKLAEMIAKYHNKKNDSLYVDVREGKIINPNDIVKKELVLAMLEMANMQIGMVEIGLKLDNSQFLTIWKTPYASILKIDDLLKS